MGERIRREGVFVGGVGEWVVWGRWVEMRKNEWTI